MKTRDEKIKAALAQAYDAILTAISNEDGLDGATGSDALKCILRMPTFFLNTTRLNQNES